MDHFHSSFIWRFPEMGVPPNHPFIDGFSMKSTIHFRIPPFTEILYLFSLTIWMLGTMRRGQASPLPQGLRAFCFELPHVMRNVKAPVIPEQRIERNTSLFKSPLEVFVADWADMKVATFFERGWNFKAIKVNPCLKWSKRPFCK